MLVGRDVEIAEVARLLAEDRAVVVTGEAGVGKTTLLRLVAEGSGRPVAEGGALSTLSWMDYLPLQRALGRPVPLGDAVAVAAEVEGELGNGVLLLDDLQWADAATLEVIGQLSGRVGILAGVRRGERASDAVVDLLRAAGFAEQPLAPLGRADAAAVVRGLRPDLPAATVDKVVARTGGNPLLLQELTATGEPTASLRLAIAARLRLLDAAGRDAFGVLALAGRPMLPEEAGEPGVKSLLAADLVVRTPSGVQVRHALLAEVLIDQMSPDDRRALHARIARAVADDGEAAQHFALAGETAAAFAAAVRAAEATQRPGEQASHLAVAAACASGPAADDLRLRAALALERAHDLDGMARTLELLSPDNHDAQAWACLLRARAAWTAGDTQAVGPALEAGLALVGGTGSEIEVRLRIERSRIPMFVDVDVAEGVRASAKALALALATGIDVARADYLHGTALAIADLPDGDSHLLAAIAAARANGDTSTEFLAANNLISYHESTDDPESGRALCEEFIARANELGMGEWEHSFRIGRIALDLHAGNYELVIPTAEALLDQAREARGRDTLTEALCIALIDVGRIDEALRRLDAPGGEFADDYRGIIQSTWVRTEAALWGGRPAVALELADRCLAMDEEDPNLEFFRTSRAWALFDLGRDPGPPAPTHPRTMLRCIRPETEAIRLLHSGDDAAAAAMFADTARLWAPYHRRGELRCLWGAGEAIRRSGDTTAAITALESLEERLLKGGWLPLLGRVQRSLRAAGVRRSAARTRNAGDLLTGRQRELLGLVGEGLTNAQIAQRLGISRHTVVSQLGSAVAKLGASSRTHAAALAVTRTG